MIRGLTFAVPHKLAFGKELGLLGEYGRAPSACIETFVPEGAGYDSMMRAVSGRD